MKTSLSARIGLTRAVGPGRERRRPRRLGVAPALLLVAGAGFMGVQAMDAESTVQQVVDGQTLFTLHGHGHGHGRGMGQWGAFGYAQQGWSAEQILAHYYGGTELGVLEPTEITVRLQARDGKPLEAHSAGPLTVAGQVVAPGQSARLTPTPGGAHVQISDACGGNVLWEGETADPWVHADGGSPARLCGEDASYRGALGVALDGGEARTISKLDIEDYLRGVVPAESHAFWADEGGAEALKAQAVAARSYAAAEARKGYAQTCDSQDCQVYRGSDVDDPRTDAAIEATRGQVLTRDGGVVPAEFSASTGGFSAGGEFPAVPDEGDAVSPLHDWTQQLTAREIADAFKVGELVSMAVVQANGLGVDGSGQDSGRVLLLRVEGTSQTVEVSGDDARVHLGLKSDWFYIEGQAPDAPAPAPDMPAPAPPEDGFGPTE